MDQVKKEELQKDWWRFMLIGSMLFSIFQTLFERSVDTDRLPFQYYLIAGMAALGVEVLLYFSIRNWPGRWKTAMAWLFALIWLAVCFTYKR
jgi:glucan phosphoethanolaminetransferase (alkaline phosphatase superfamily)